MTELAKPEQRRISASRLKALDACTMQFYLSEYLKLPQKVWARTVVGTVCHAILECLYRDKHRKHYDAIKMAGTIYASKAVARQLKMWQDKELIGQDLINDVDGMIMVVINNSNFLDEGATKRFEPEHEFRLELKNGGIVKGFIDRLAQFSKSFIISDYKSQRNRFTAEEVKSSFQSLVYQLYVFKTFGALAEVDYLLLRHPPTKRTPNKHLQITPPATPTQLAGFELYLEHMSKVVNNFTEDDAKCKYHGDTGFCDRVCSYRFKFDYISIKKKATGELVGNYYVDKCPQVKDDQVSERHTFPGCPRFNSNTEE